MKKPKRERLIPYGKLMKLAVQAFNGWVRRRDKACVTCGTTKNPTCGHLITAKVLATRFSEINSARQCAKCNWIHERHPERYIVWFVGHYGWDAFLELVDESMKKKKYTRAELHQIIEKYS